MSNYTKATDFAQKDGLPTNDPNKVIKGAEFEDEFDLIATAVNSKADTASPTFTGTATLPTAVVTTLSLGGTTITSTGTELNILDGVTASTAELNLLDGVTATTAELNILDGVTSTASELNLVDGSSAGTVVNDKAVVYSSAGQVKATTLSIGNWVIKVDTNELVFEYDSTEVFKVGTNGAVTSADNVTAFGTI
tara:strand:- start:90 stop:671 length:582 start_codon:yes stop_codon:yes gene_type:complete